jgi:hypothetical protein
MGGEGSTTIGAASLGPFPADRDSAAFAADNAALARNYCASFVRAMYSGAPGL